MPSPASIFTGTSTPTQPKSTDAESNYRALQDQLNSRDLNNDALQPQTPPQNPPNVTSSSTTTWPAPQSGDKNISLRRCEPAAGGPSGASIKNNNQPIASPPAVVGQKRSVRREDSTTAGVSEASSAEPLHKRRRIKPPKRHTTSSFDFPQAALKNPTQPPSPLFFSNSRRSRPHLPARFSSSEAAARMLSKTRGEESVKTVTLARGTFSGLSPPGVTSGAPARSSSERSSLSRTFSPDVPERSDPLRLLGSVGVVEVLENDTRPTFIVDLADGSNYTLAPTNLHILFANNALRSASSLWELISGSSSGETRDVEVPHGPLQFKNWLLGAAPQKGNGLAEPSPIEYAGVTWSCFTLRRRLRVVSAAAPTVLPPKITPTSDPAEAAIPSSTSRSSHYGSDEIASSSPAVDRSEPRDYFGSTVAVMTEEPAPLTSTDISPGVVTSERDAPRAHLGITPKPEKGGIERVDQTPGTPHDHDVGFFDWTRLSLSSSLPRHIQFALSVDWAATPLGPIEYWTSDLRAMCNLIMASPHPAAMYWGDELVAIYNEAYIGLAGQKHPRLMGQSYKLAWAEIWDDVKDVFNNARLTGQATMKDDDCLFMKRNGFLEETYFSWSIIPMVGEDGTVMGLYNPAFEKTRRKIAERRMLTLREVGERTATARDVKSFFSQVIAALTENEHDTPFALIYSVSDDNDSDCSSLHSASLLGNKTCYLEGSLGVPPNHPCAPSQMDLKEGHEGFGPVFREVMKTDKPVVLSIGSGDLPAEMMEGLEWRGFGDPCRDVVVCPIHPTTGEAILGFLVVGVNPRRPFDDDYNLFIQLLGRQLGTSIASVMLFEEEIRRGQKAAKLAAEDRLNLSEQLAARTQEARDSETRFTRMAEYSPAGLFIADDEGRITYCNEAWYEITRVPKEPQKTDRWIDYVKEDDQWIVQEHWKGLVDHADAINIEFRFKTPWEDRNGNKGDTWVLFSAFPETYEGGKLKSVFGSITNISPQKWAEDFQKRKMEEAVEMKRQQENFIDITSHEMRNPLSAILQCADEISTTLAEFRDAETSAIPPAIVMDSIDAAQTIALCAQHQKRIVDDVLTLSKLDSAMLMVTPVDAQPLQVVQRALKMFEGEVQTAGIEMSFVVSDSYNELGIDWVKVDPSRVLQVLINLTTNAIKFTTTETKRTIKVILSASRTRPSASKNPTVDFFPSRSNYIDDGLGPDWGDGEQIYLEFAVQDTGRGLTDEEKKLLFQRFSQASPRTHVQYGGSGLGLFISRELTELQGGEIGVSSEAGKGSTFAFYVRCRKSSKPPEAESFPINMPLSNSKDRSRYSISKSRSSSLNPKPESTDSGKTQKGQMKVLIVEDNLVNQRVLQRQLHNQGIATHVANHGGEALDKLKESWYWADNPEDALDVGVVLMDKEMPVMDGLQCTSEIRQWEDQGLLRCHIPIIAVTANARSEQIATLRAAGMDDVVSKPFRISELVPKIEELSRLYPRGSGS